MTSSLGTELALKEYQNNQMLFFQDVPHENLWIEMTERAVNCGIVCGSGKKWRAEQVRTYVISNPEAFRKLLDRLRTSVDSTFRIFLRVHSWFRYSRFRTAWLGDLGGVNPYPDGYKTFLATITDRNLNAFDYVSKDTIQERFVSIIDKHKQEGSIKVDSEGRFPEWHDIDQFLQYTYFHVDVQIPSTVLVGRPNDSLFKTFKSLLEPQHDMMRALSAL
jgi:hypothetical protein